MGKKKSGGLILAAFGIAVTLTVVLVMPVFAQDDPQPQAEPTQTSESTAAPATETSPGPSGSQDSDETLPANPAPLLIPEIEPVFPSIPSQDSSEEMESDSFAVGQDSLAQTLAENELVVADTGGAPLSLVSNAVSSAADPYFTVGTTKYQFFPLGDLRCDELTIFCSATPIQAAVDKLLENNWVPIDGTIYVETGIYTENVLIDGSLVYGTTTSKPLSLLKALKGAGSYETTDAPSTINGSVTVMNVLNGFTLSGFVIDATGVTTAGVVFDNNTGTITIKDVEVKNSGGDGISVTNQKGAVNLDTVSSHDNKLHGAEIVNSMAAFPVIVTNSAFRGNAAEPTWTRTNGLHILSLGSATITGVVSSENFGDGLYIYANGITIRHSLFNSNKKRNGSYFGTEYYGSGIFGYTDPAGNILIEDVTANHNSYSGIDLGSRGTFTLNQVIANGNAGSGLSIGSASTMSVKNIIANDNGFRGIHINCYGDTKQIPATLNNIETKRNGNSGVFVYGSGTVTMTGFVILENGSGLDINNDTGVYTSSAVNLTDGNVNSNKGFGIRIQSMGNVKLVDVSASRNDANKRYIFADRTGIYPDILHSDVDEWDLKTSWPANFSIRIVSDQVITATLLRLYQGAYVPLPGGQITGSDITFDHSLILPGDGYRLQVDGSGIVDPVRYYAQLSDPDAQWDDSEVQECSFLDNFPCGLFIYNTRGSISITNGDYSANGSNGIWVNSTSVNLSTVSASGNGGYGWHTIFDSTLIGKPVNLTGYFNNFSDNGFDGVNIISSGVVSLSNLTASRNGRNGIFIDNNVGTGSITVQHILPDPSRRPVTFDENGWSGLWIFSKGTVTIKDIQASNNGGYGAFVDNCLFSDVDNKCFGSGTVSLLVNSGYDNTFENNAYSGLSIKSKGAITTYNLIANRNGQSTENAGVILDNDWNGAAGGVAVSSNSSHINSFFNNGEAGLIIYSRGAIKVAMFEADQNFTNGIYLYNQNALTPQSVTVSYGQANENQNGNGVLVRSKGAITVTDVESNFNDILAGTMIPGETLNEVLTDSQAASGDYWYFSTNQEQLVFAIEIKTDFEAEFSLWVRSGEDYMITPYSGSGTSWNQVIPTLNIGDYFIKLVSQSDTGGRYSIALDDPVGNISRAGGAGLDLSNNILGGVGSIKITGKSTRGSLITHNSSIGVIADAKGAVTITDIFSNYNGSLGALISSTGGVSIGNIANEFCVNGSDGLRISANGAITLTNVDAYENAGYGAILDNYQNPTGAVTINTSGVTSNWYSSFSANELDGLVIRTKGVVSLKQVGAGDNGGNGLVITNQDSPAKGAVSISNGFFSRNGLRGILVETKGAVTLASLNANANDGDFGIHIKASGTGVTNLSKVQVNWNHENGLFVETAFTISVNAIQANENGGYGAKLVSTYNPTTLVTGITFLSTLGQNKFYGNGENLGFNETDLAGLVIQSNKAVVISQLFSGYNRGYGVTITSNANVSITSGLTEYNSLSGLSVLANGGAITLSGFSAYSNGLASTALDTAGVILNSSNQKISVTNSAFHGNGDYGIRIFITAPNTLTWVNNTAFGNNLDDQGARNFKLN